MIKTYSGRKETWQTHNLKDKLQDDVVVNPTKKDLQNKIECLRSITRFPSILRERSTPPERSHRNYHCHLITYYLQCSHHYICLHLTIYV